MRSVVSLHSHIFSRQVPTPNIVLFRPWRALMAKKHSGGFPRPFPRGNPRRASLAMNGAMDAQPLGGTMSRVTKQKIPHSYARHSDSLDSISDEEDNRRGSPFVRSHVQPNKNFDAYAEIRTPRMPQAPHDTTKPGIMKHPDLPSTHISSRDKNGSIRTKPMHPPTRPLSTASDRTCSSDCVPPSFKIPRLSTSSKMEVKEQFEERSVRNGDRRVPISQSTPPVREDNKESGIHTKRTVEVDTPKLGMAPTEPKMEVKEETMEREVKTERNDEEEDARYTRLKMKKARPSEELTKHVKMKRDMNMKKEIKEEEVEVITID